MQFRAKIDCPDFTEVKAGETVTVLQAIGQYYEVKADNELIDELYFIDANDVKRSECGWEFVV